MPQALYRKWRPRRWEAVVGQDHVVQTLRNAVAADRVAHAYLFAGPRGTGKTTTARLLAKAVNCLDEDLSNRPCDRCDHCLAVQAGRFLDLIEIDAASNTSVDDVRDLRDKINFSPNQGRFKVYVIDEVHMLSNAAFNALLKTLEEPPPHAIFILATTEVHKIPATVLSRCQRHEFRRISTAEIANYLQTIADGENLEVEDEALSLIARQATGSLRDAISLLDQLASTGQKVSLERAQTLLGTTTSQAVISVVAALAEHDPAGGLDAIHQTLEAGTDPRQFARQLVDYLRGVLLMRMGSRETVEATAEVRRQMEQHARAFPVPDLLRAIRSFNQAANEARSSWQPSLPLEVAFLVCLEPESGSQPEARSETLKPPASQTKPTARPTQARQQQADAEPVSAAGQPGESEPENQENQALTRNWPQVLVAVKKGNPNTYGLLNSCRTRHLVGKTLTLGFASDVLKNQMVKKENLALVQQALDQIVGPGIVIRCVTSTARRDAIPPEVDSDGMVASALRDLGGEIVDIQ
jgi:DNA polymerase III subunit gamma/tau